MLRNEIRMTEDMKNEWMNERTNERTNEWIWNLMTTS